MSAGRESRLVFPWCFYKPVIGRRERREGVFFFLRFVVSSCWIHIDRRHANRGRSSNFPLPASGRHTFRRLPLDIIAAGDASVPFRAMRWSVDEGGEEGDHNSIDCCKEFELIVVDPTVQTNAKETRIPHNPSFWIGDSPRHELSESKVCEIKSSWVGTNSSRPFQATRNSTQFPTFTNPIGSIGNSVQTLFCKMSCAS